MFARAFLIYLSLSPYTLKKKRIIKKEKLILRFIWFYKSLWFGSFQKVTSIIFFKGKHFGQLETVVWMVILKSFSQSKRIEVAMQAIKKQSNKWRVTAKRQPNPRHATQPKQTKHKLKYSEASRSSFLKLVFDNIKPNRGHVNNHNSKLISIHG